MRGVASRVGEAAGHVGDEGEAASGLGLCEGFVDSCHIGFPVYDIWLDASRLTGAEHPCYYRRMPTVIRAQRRSAVLTPSALPCLRALPTVNLTAGCLHGCLYCYGRSYRQFPGEDKIILYENTLDLLRDELARRLAKPAAVYFSPSSDLFQPAPEVLELGESIIRFLLDEGVGVAFLTKGRIPDHVLGFLSDHAELVRAQIGIITTDEGIARTFEPSAAHPKRRLAQIEALFRAGVPTEARVDPILPTVTDDPEATDGLFRALADAGVRHAAVDLLFLRAAIVESLRRNMRDKDGLARLLGAFPRWRACGAYTRKLPLEARRRTFAFMREMAAASWHRSQSLRL